MKKTRNFKGLVVSILFLLILSSMFITLKLGNYLIWNWFWVILPIIISIIISLLYFINEIKKRLLNHLKLIKKILKRGKK